MPGQRLRGQETSILIVRGGALEAELVDVRKFSFVSETEIKSTGFLGEKSNRKDMIFNGFKGDFELHVHSDDWLRFTIAVNDIAKRNTPDVQINITSVFSLPNGSTPTVLFPDVSFGPINNDVPDRGEYVTIKLEFEGSEFSVTF